ncbi:MAG: 5-(carboxyamino)imidazole ribonucleotide synthase [Cytophagales bacterium]|nr:5-(carboxyamino)imidazole ribonucleotide synthase [Cytophaga sp.]
MEHFYSDYKIGMLGGGQLGRMLLQAAVDYNLEIHVLDPDAEAPCKNWGASFTQGVLTDFNTVYQFGKDKDLITIEIENVNVEALKKLQQEGTKVYPQPEIIEMIQNKCLQKEFYTRHNIPTADFILTKNKEDILKHLDLLPAVHKLATDGYDGRGVQMIRTKEDISKGFDKPGLLEKLIDFDKELSVIVARNHDGEITAFPTVEMVFHPVQNLVEFLFAPADISPELHKKAEKIARQVINEIGLVGILAVEMFLTKDGEILVNEIAPRPHNSGHQTIQANYTSQYEQHLRAILNMPLGATNQLCPAAMVNLLGEAGFVGNAIFEGLEEAMNIEGVYPHLYGKKITKPFRKMGHVTILDTTIEGLKKKSEQVKHLIKIKA